MSLFPGQNRKARREAARPRGDVGRGGVQPEGPRRRGYAAQGCTGLEYALYMCGASSPICVVPVLYV